MGKERKGLIISLAGKGKIMKLRLKQIFPFLVALVMLVSCSKNNDCSDQLYSAQKLYNVGDLNAAESACKEILKFDKDNEFALFLLSKVLFYGGKKSQSLIILEKLYEDRPDFLDAKLFYALELIDAGKLDYAEHLLNRELYLNSKDYRVHHLLFLIAKKTSNVKKMIECEKKAAFCLNDSYRVYMELSLIYSNLGMQDMANEYKAKGRIVCTEESIK